ncbi:aldolase-type TIM barrel family protein [Wolffia australiana]
MAMFYREDNEYDRPEKPRVFGVTEMRGAFYSRSQATRQSLHDTLETMGQFVDGLRFSGGSYTLAPRSSIKEIIRMAHERNVYVSSGDWGEQVLRRGPAAFKEYVEDCRDMGFDLIEPNSSFINFPEEALLRLVRMIKSEGLRARPGLSCKFDPVAVPAGGDKAFGAYIPLSDQESGMIENVDLLIRKAERCIEAGADAIMISIDDDADLATDVIARVVGRLGLDRTMFEALDGAAAEWFVTRYGPRVNLFVDHSQIMGLECLRNHGVGRRRRSIVIS